MVKLQRNDSSDSLLNNGPRSEYVKRYQVYEAEKAKSYRPKHNVVKADAPIDSETVFRRDYPEHPLPKRQAVKPSVGNLRSEGNQDFTSSYQNEFPERPTERRKPYKPDTTRSDLAAFDAQPSYRDDYPEWELPKKHQQEKQKWHPPDQPFEGQTTNMNHYTEHQVSPRAHHKPEHKLIQADSPFNASSDYRDTYREHPLPPKSQRAREQWTKPVVPLDDVTTQQRDFKGEYLPKQKSMKPEANIVKSEVPIDGDTTHSTTYRPHDLPQRYRHEPQKYKQPEGSMDFNTTHGMQYTEHPLDKQVAYKPDSSNILKGSGEMVKDTNYNKDYQEYPISRVGLVKPKHEYSQPAVPMETLTEYQADFYGRKPEPRQEFKPKDTAIQSDQPFDDRTDYRDRYIEHKITPREQRPREVYSGPTEPLDARTTAREAYLGPYQPKQKSFKPNRDILKSDVPFNSTTVTNTDFKEHKVSRREAYKADAYHKPDGDMDFITSHNTHYKEHPLQRQKLDRPGSSNLLKGTGEMTSKTNYQGDFIEYPIDRQKMIKPNNDYQPPVDTMTSETTHRSHFHEHQLPERHNFKPTDNSFRSDAPLDDRTGYRDSFVPHKVTPRETRQKEVHQPPSAPFDDRTTVRDSYQGSFLPKRESFRPDLNMIKSNAPFDGNTTMNTDFREHQIPERFKYKYDSYHKPDGEMDLTTTNTTNYTEHALHRQTVTRPESSGLLKGFGEMRKDTNYQGDFKEPHVVKREIYKAKNDYNPPTAPMATSTTNQESYQEHGLTPRVSFRPRNEYLKPEAPLEDSTHYRDKFIEHQITPREPKAKEVYKPPSAPLDSRTTANLAYLGAYQPKQESFRPDRNYIKSDAPLESDTTSRVAFQQWSVGDRQRHKPEQYVKPDGQMDLTTVNRETYKDVRGEKPQLVRLSSSHLLSNQGKFNDITSYSNDFVPKSLESRMRFKPDNQYVPSAMPFEDKTEYRASHVGYVAPRDKSFKPDRWSDALGQRDPTNPFHIRTESDWRKISSLNMKTTVKG